MTSSPPPGAGPSQPGPQSPSPAGGARRPGGGIAVKQIIAAVLIVVAVIFLLENTRKVTVRLIGPEVRVPLYLPLLIAFVLGALATFLLVWRRHRSTSRRR